MSKGIKPTLASPPEEHAFAVTHKQGKEGRGGGWGVPLSSPPKPPAATQPASYLLYTTATVGKSHLAERAGIKQSLETGGPVATGQISACFEVLYRQLIM